MELYKRKRNERLNHGRSWLRIAGMAMFPLFLPDRFGAGGWQEGPRGAGMRDGRGTKFARITQSSRTFTKASALVLGQCLHQIHKIFVSLLARPFLPNLCRRVGSNAPFDPMWRHGFGGNGRAKPMGGDDEIRTERSNRLACQNCRETPEATRIRPLPPDGLKCPRPPVGICE